jgi:hypothetical protein
MKEERKIERRSAVAKPFADRGNVTGMLAAMSGVLFFTVGCGHAPTFSILGSFFPAWLFCIAAGILLAALCYGLFVRLQMAGEIRPAILVYPCLAAFFAFTLWLMFFR